MATRSRWASPSYAADQLGDVVFVELPDVGRSLGQHATFGVVESVKAVSDLFSPVTGEVTEANAQLAGSPELVNADPFGAGWMIRMRLADAGQLDELLDADGVRAADLGGLTIATPRAQRPAARTDPADGREPSDLAGRMVGVRLGIELGQLEEPHVVDDSQASRLLAAGRPTDAELIRRLQADELDAFEAFFERYRGLIHRTAYGLTGDAGAAEEVLQDTFIRAYRHRASLRTDVSPVPWLHRVALNLCYSRLGRRRLNVEPIGETTTELREPGLEPAEHAEREELRRSIRTGVAALPPKHQSVVVLYYLHGMSLAGNGRGARDRPRDREVPAPLRPARAARPSRGRAARARPASMASGVVASERARADGGR